MCGFETGRESLKSLCAFATLAILIVAVGPAAWAVVTTSPPSATVVAGDTSQPVILTVTYPASPVGGPATMSVLFFGFPAGVTTSPSSVLLTGNPGGGTASTSFAIVTSADTLPGTYPVSITLSPDVGAGTGSFVLVIPTPSFGASIAPNPLTLPWGGTAAVAVSTTTEFGFSSDISYAFTGFPSGITSGPAQTARWPYAPLEFPFAVAPRTPPGVHTGALVATWRGIGLQTRSFPMTVIVQPPTLTASFSPAMMSLVEGGPAAEGNLTLTPGAGYSGTPTLSWASIPPGLEVTPTALPAPSLPPAQSVPVSVRAKGAAPGVHTLSLRVIDGGAAVDVTALLVATVAAPPDAAIAVVPPALSVVAGSSANVTVTAAAINGFSGTLSVASPSLASTSLSPASFSLRGGESRIVSVQAAESAVPGTVVATFTATSPEISGSRTATLVLTVLPQPPEISSATPSALTSGTIGVPIRLAGINFRTGAVVTITPPGPLVTSTIVSSSTLGEILVTTPSGTPAGRYEVNLRNPDGETTANGVPLIVYPPSSLGAPLSVPTAAIVFPRPFTAVANGESVLPRAVIATTGVGTIIGTWQLDGVPFDQFVVTVSGGLPVEVTAKIPIPVAVSGEHRLVLTIDQPQKLTTEAVPLIVAIESQTGLRVLEPEDGAELSRSEPRFRWTLVPGASGYEIEIESPDGASPRRIRLSDSRWSPDPKTIAEIGAGTHRWRVAAVFTGDVRGEPTAWLTFVIADEDPNKGSGSRESGAATQTGLVRLVSWSDPSAESTIQSNETPAPSPDAVAPALPRDWDFTLLGSASATDEDVPSIADAARLQLTTAGDVEDSNSVAKWTGDLSGRKDLDPEYVAASESRAWQFELGARQSRTGEELRAGYSPPSFLDQSEFLAAGLARGGVLGKVTTPIGSVSLYDTFHDDAAGAVSTYELAQRLSGAAWEAPLDPNRALFRVIGLRARSDATADTPETESEAFGALWKINVSPALALTFEGAHGTLDGVTKENGDEYDGFGLHLGASGTKGTFSYVVDIRKVDADLVNPANIGLSVGAVPDRIGGDLTLGKIFGSANVSLQLRTLESGALADGSGESVSENSGTLTLIAPLGARVSCIATSSYTTTSGDADPQNFMPASDRAMAALGLTFTEQIKSLAFSQSLAWQDLSDETNPAFDSTVTSGSLTAGGMIGTRVMLTALFSGTRSESPDPVGVTDLWLASLQPTFNWAATALSVTPRASFTRVESELGGTSDTEQYQLIAQWSPAWWRSLINLQVGADWNRSATEGLPTPSFDQRIVASVTLRWGLSRAQLRADPVAALPVVPSAIHARRQPNDLTTR